MMVDADIARHTGSVPGLLRDDAARPMKKHVPAMTDPSRCSICRPSTVRCGRQLLDASTRVCDSQRCILGEEVLALERELATTSACATPSGVSSGTDALLVALMALGVGAGDEVITPTFSFFATAGCVARLGARPVFVDIDPQDLQPRPRGRCARAITPRTKAIMPVHLFGQAVDMAALMALAGARACRSSRTPRRRLAPATASRRSAASACAGCFSFYPTKNLGAFGDGGLVTTNDARHGRAGAPAARSRPAPQLLPRGRSAATSASTPSRARCCA